MNNNFRRLSVTTFYLVILSVVACSAISTAATPQLINYQGYLKQNGLPVNASVNMEFRLFDAPGGGVQLCTSGLQSIAVNYGRFNYQIGTAGCNLSAFDWQAQPVYLEIIVEGNTMSPREQLTATPYSLSSDAGTPLTGFTIDNDNIAAAASSSVYFDGGAGANASLTWDAPGNRFMLTTDGSTPADVRVGVATATAYFGDGSNLTGITAIDSTRVAKAGDAMTGNLNISQGGATSSLVVLQTGAADGAGYFETTVPGIGNAVTAVSHSNGGGNAISAEHDGSAGAVAFFAQTGAINSSPALEVTTGAGSSAADFSNTDPTSASSTVNITTNSTSGGGALRAHSTGTAKAVVFSISNAANTAPVLAISTNSSQTSSSLIEGNHTGTAGDLIVLKSSGQRKAVVDRTGNIFASGAVSFDGSLIVSGSEGAPGEALVSNGPGAAPTWQIVGGGNYVDATGDTMSGALGIAQGGATASLYAYQTGTTNPAAYIETTNGGSAQPTLVLRGAGAGPLYAGNQTGIGELLHLMTSGQDKFVVQKNGNLFASGSVTGFELNALSEIYINPDGPDGDSQINFYEAATPNGAYLRWSDGNSRFEFSGDIFTNSNMGASALASDGDMYLNYDGGIGDSRIYFYTGGSQTGAEFRWDEGMTRFAYSHGLIAGGDIDLGGNLFTDSSVNPVRMGDSLDMNGNTITDSTISGVKMGDTLDLNGNTLQDANTGTITLGSVLNLNGNALQDDTLGDIVLGDSLDMNGHTLVDSGAGGVKMGDSLDMNSMQLLDSVSGNVTLGSHLDLNGGTIFDNFNSVVSFGNDINLEGNMLTDSALNKVTLGDHLDMNSFLLKDDNTGFVTMGSAIDMNTNQIVDTGGNVTVNDTLEATSMRSNGNLFMNSAGPDGESIIYFYDGFSDMGQYIKWSDPNGRFEISSDLKMEGTGNFVMNGSEIHVKDGGPDGDQFIYFFNNAGFPNESLMWDDLDDEFEFSDDTRVVGVIAATSYAAPVSVVNSDGFGNAASFAITSAHADYAVDVSSNGSVAAMHISTSAAAPQALLIESTNGGNSSPALEATQQGTGPAIKAANTIGPAIVVNAAEPAGNIMELKDGGGTDLVVFNSSGDVTTSGNLLSKTNAYINATGADGDSFLYFYENVSDSGAYLKWDDTNSRFSLSHGIFLNDSLIGGLLDMNGISIADTSDSNVDFSSHINTNGYALKDTSDTQVDFLDDIDMNGFMLFDSSGPLQIGSGIDLNGTFIYDSAGNVVLNSPLDFNGFSMLDGLGGSIAMGDNLNGGGIYNIINPSDERLKKNIRTIPGALDKMLALRGVNFQWNEPEKFGGHDGDQMGMIAQEVQRVFPEWIVQEDTGYLHLSIKGFEALAVESIRELNTKYDELAKKTDALEKENADLKTAIEEIKARLSAIEAR